MHASITILDQRYIHMTYVHMKTSMSISKSSTVVKNLSLKVQKTFKFSYLADYTVHHTKNNQSCNSLTTYACISTYYI